MYIHYKLDVCNSNIGIRQYTNACKYLNTVQFCSGEEQSYFVAFDP